MQNNDDMEASEEHGVTQELPISNLVSFAKQELDIAGIVLGKDELDSLMHKSVLDLVDLFSRQGHSGSSASLTISILAKLLAFKPLTPLTGEDDEWVEVPTFDDPEFPRPQFTHQNKRCFSVCKRSDGKVFDTGGIIWYRDHTDDEGLSSRQYFTNSDSFVEISFPYEPKTEYLPYPEI